MDALLMLADYFKNMLLTVSSWLSHRGYIGFTWTKHQLEIKNFVTIRGLTASDRLDIVCIIFKEMFDHMMSDFKK